MTTQDNILNNRYRLESQHGSGGMSVIYRATDLALGRQVAVKILRPSLTNEQSFLVRFRQEARNVANLQHPNIVTVHDVGQDGNTHYIVMELIDGNDLKKEIRAGAPFALDRTLDIAINICAGIGYAHRAGLVHADVKPQNILVVGKEIKVTDFGIAQALAASDPNERQKIVWGSPHYFSPEQAQGRNPTPSSDVYSIGIVLFEMLTGRLPYSGNDQQELAWAHIRQTPPHIQEFNPTVPEQLDRIIQKVLAKEPEARYRMADQLGRILINYRDQGLGKTNNSPAILLDQPQPASKKETQERESTPPPSEQTEPAPNRDKSPFASPESPDYEAAKTVPNMKFTEAASPPTQPNVQSVSHPQQQQPMMGGGYTQSPTSSLRDSGYYPTIESQGIDVTTIVLSVVAFIAVLGVVILWFFVFQAYA